MFIDSNTAMLTSAAIERRFSVGKDVLKQGCATFFTGGPLSKILTTSRASHRQICIKL